MDVSSLSEIHIQPYHQPEPAPFILACVSCLARVLCNAKSALYVAYVNKKVVYCS